MKELLDRVKKHIVIVEGGSGVLIQPNSNGFSYVLTAKHVLDKVKEIEDIKIKNIEEKTIQVLDILKHDSLDIAILKVDFQDNLEALIINRELEVKTEIDLYGYPVKERDHGSSCYDKLNKYSLKIHDYKKDEIIFNNESYADFGDIQGFSGGGLFYTKGNLIFLIGVENGMSSSNNENNTNISGVPVGCFVDLIEINGWPKILPTYLRSLKYSENNIFLKLNLEEENNMEKFNHFFKNLVEKNNIYMSGCFRPYNIVKDFGAKLVSCRQDENILNETKLWIFMLEFISVLLCIENIDNNIDQWDKKFIFNIFNNYRFVFSNEVVGYRSILKKFILETDFSNLNEKSKIICFIDGDSPDDYKIPVDVTKKTLSNITSAVPKENIAFVKKNVYLKNDIIHWNKLNDICLAKEDVFLEFCEILEGDKILETIKNRYLERLQKENLNEL